MILTVFRSRLRPEHLQDYAAKAGEIAAAAQTMPGYVAHKSFVAEDGERVTLVEFESHETQRAWANHPGHREAQRLGREKFYSDYAIQVCEVVTERRFPGNT